MLVGDLTVFPPDLTAVRPILAGIVENINKSLENPTKFPVTVRVECKNGPLDITVLLKYLDKVYNTKGWHVSWGGISNDGANVSFAPQLEYLLKEMGYAS